MIQTFQNYLSNRGIDSNILDANTHTLLSFSIDDVNYLFSYRRAADANYIRLMIPFIGTIDRGNSEAILDLFTSTSNFKVGKYVIENETQIWIVVEAFIYIQSDHARLFDRLINVATDMLNDYRHSTHG